LANNSGITARISGGNSETLRRFGSRDPFTANRHLSELDSDGVPAHRGQEQTGNLFWSGDARNRDLAGSENAYAATALLCISRAQKSGRYEINRSALKP